MFDVAYKSVGLSTSCLCSHCDAIGLACNICQRMQSSWESGRVPQNRVSELGSFNGLFVEEIEPEVEMYFYFAVIFTLKPFQPG